MDPSQVTPAAFEKSMVSSVNPVTGALVTSVEVDGTDDVRAAVAAARASAETWSNMTAQERGRHLLAARRSFADRAPEIAEAITAEMGKPLVDAYLEVLAGCQMLGWAARHAPKLLIPRKIATAPLVFKRATVRYEPLGVIGVISPWNYPVAIPMQSIPYALAAGNTVVFKPSELTLRTGQLIADAINAAGIDLVQVVSGDGSTGEALVRSGTNKIVFTGSAGVGRKIMAAAADTLTPVVMELGGKDVAIVCADADLDRAARTVVAAAFTNAGQLCMATERALVDTSVHDEFVDRVLEVARELRCGPGADAHLGPLTRPAQAEMLKRRLADATQDGARVVLGGDYRREGTAVYFDPTVVLDTRPEMELLREESFGPILSVMKVAGPREALALANDSAFGLNSSVFTTNASLAAELAEGIQAGGVHVNDALVGNGIPGVPFGGVKGSGFGRLQGDVGLFEFVASKTVIDERTPRAPGLAAMMAAPKRPKPSLVGRLIAVAYSSKSPQNRLLGRRR